MARRPAWTYAPELTDAERAEFRPAREVHSPEELAALTSVRKRGRPVARAPKIPVTIRLDARVVDAFTAAGPGWQTRINAVLLAGLEPEAAKRDGKPLTRPASDSPSRR